METVQTTLIPLDITPNKLNDWELHTEIIGHVPVDIILNLADKFLAMKAGSKRSGLRLQHKRLVLSLERMEFMFDVRFSDKNMRTTSYYQQALFVDAAALEDTRTQNMVTRLFKRSSYSDHTGTY